MYTQRLGMFFPENAADDDRYIDEFLQMIKENEGSCDEVWLTTAYGYPSLARHKEIAERTKAVADKLRASGLRVSMQIANTIGHGSYMVGRDCSGLVYEGSPVEILTGPDGTTSDLCFCWRGENFIEYCKKVMEYYSVIKPYRVWVDDDLRARNHAPVENGCFCDACMAKFNARYAHSYNREELVYTMNRTDKEVRREWTEFLRDGLHDFVLELVREFIKYSPDTLFALQNGANGGYTGYGLDHLFSAMHEATGKNVGYRAGGSAYNDHKMTSLLNKARSLEYQNSLLPDYVDDIRPEIECLPDVPYGKSAYGIIFETDLHFAHGATGMSYAMIMRRYEPLLGYHSREFAAFARHRKYLTRLSDCNKRTKPSGAEYMLSKNGYLRDLDPDEPDFAYGDIGSFEGGLPPIFGLPVCYNSGDKTKVYQLTPLAVKSLPKEDIEFLLTQPVFTDGECVSMLIEKGYDVFGINAYPVPTVAVVEKFLPCEVNKDLLGTEWGQTYYCHNGYAFLPKRDKVMAVNAYSATNPTLKEFFPEEEKYKFGLEAVICETGKGGKWAIFGNDPWWNIISYDRRNQLLAVMDHISDGKAISAYLLDPEQAIVRPRVTDGGNVACVSVVSTTTGDKEDLTLVIRNPESERFDFMWGDGIAEDLKYEKKNNEYHITIPHIKGWSVGTVFCK